jgi:hypothetical protein
MSDIKEEPEPCPQKSISTKEVYWNKTINRIIKNTLRDVDKLSSNYNDIVLESFIEKNKDVIRKSHMLKFIQMKIGQIWQEVIGSVDGITNLGVGDPSGLDIISNYKFKTKFIMELKNSYKTDNASSRKENLNKLVKYTQSNPEYAPIYGIVNCNSKMNEGKDTIQEHNTVKVRMLSGNKLLHFIFGDDYTMIVRVFKYEIDMILK